MKTKERHFTNYLPVALLMAALLFFLFSIRSFAKDGYTVNSYNGVTYETNEEKLELEKILRADGYICVSSWCTDDEEATNRFRENDFFFGKEFIDSETVKVYVSPVSYKSMMQDGADNMDTVLIDWYSFTEESENLEGEIAYNYTDNPKNIKSGDEGTGTLIINSTVNEEILKKYAYTKATFIFASYDTNKRFEIDLNAANGFSSMDTIVYGNYYVESIYLGNDCIPTYDVDDFTIYTGTVTINVDFTANWESSEETVTSETESEEITTLDPTSEENTLVTVEEKEKNWMPLIVTSACIAFLMIAGVIIFVVLKKKMNSDSM